MHVHSTLQRVSSFRVPRYVHGKVVFVGKEMPPRVCSNSFCVALCSDVEYFEHFCIALESLLKISDHAAEKECASQKEKKISLKR